MDYDKKAQQVLNAVDERQALRGFRVEPLPSAIVAAALRQAAAEAVADMTKTIEAVKRQCDNEFCHCESHAYLRASFYVPENSAPPERK